MTTLTLLLVAVLICHGGASFDCRRPQQSCVAGVCEFTSDICTTCGATNEAYDCGVVSAQISAGCTICENGGTCYDAGAGDLCYCDADFYGDTCELKRFDVVCEVDQMTIGINPEGDFSNGIAYIKTKRGTTACEFSAVPGPPNPADDIPDTWDGEALTVTHTSADCDPITVATNCKEQSRIIAATVRNLREDTHWKEGANSVYKRTVIVQYDEKLITSLEDQLEIRCVFDPDNVLVESSVYEVDPLDFNNLKSGTVQGEFVPATLALTAGGTPVDPTAAIVIGTEVLFTFSVPAVIERLLSIPEVVDIQKVFSLAANKGDISSYNFLPLGRSAGTPGFWRNGTEANSEYGAILLWSGTANDNNIAGTLQTMNIVENGCMHSDASGVMVLTPARADPKIVTVTLAMWQFYGFTAVKFEFVVRVCLTADVSACDPVPCTGGNQFGRRKREATSFNETKIEQIVTVMDPDQFREYEQRKAEEAECNTSKQITAAMIVMGIVILTLLTLCLILIAKIAMSRKSRAQSKQDLYSAGSVQSMPQI